MGRRGVFGRVRTVLVFSMLLIACVAAPVLARSTGSGAAGSPKIGISDARALGTSQASGSRGSELTQPSESVEAEPAPGAEEPGEAGPVAEAPFEPQREPVLETPQAIAERQESQLAYSEITPAEEASLLKESFAPQLQEISADPSRLLGAAKLDQIFSPTEALASVEGEPALIDSSVPLRASNSEGKLSKVDLGLEETQQGYSPANPLVDVQLPRTAAGQIGVGDEGLSLSLQGASPKAEASQTDGGGVFVPEAGEDTSLLLAPISAGLELSAMLTSRLSPEQLAFSVSLPEGDQLRAASDGGAEVIDPQGEVTYRLFAPRAIDAQGTVLPVALAVEGNTLLISLKHREMDVAYPILIDPEFIAEGWSNIIGSGKWTWEWSGVPNSETYIGSFSCVVAKQEGCNWGTGLYVRSRSNTTYPEHSYGRWKLNAPNTTSYFRYASMGPAHFNARGCTANEPHGYFGIWLGGASWSMLGPAYPSGWTTELIAPTWGPPLSTAGHTAFVGLEAEHASNITCGRDYALTGATFYMSDPENPTVSGLSGIPSGWIKGGTPFTVTEPVSDNGLGVKSAKLNSDGGESPQSLSCSGSLSNPCPASHNFEFSVNAGTFPEGQRTISASAKDVLEKSSNTQEAALKIDRTKPGVILKGQLAEATEEEGGLAAEEEDETPFDPLHLAVYNLTIEATDVGTSGDANAKKRSGVKRIEAFLDGSKTPLKTWTQPGEPSTCDSCALTATYTLKLNELGADTHHTLRVLATDFAGNDPREREIGFEYVPATGEKDEYVMQHFPLFDTEAEPEEGVEATGPELAVNLMNGNLVFHQQDVEVPGPAADLEVERFYNSLLPEDQNTEWGDGWTLAQTPELELEEPKSGPPAEGTLVEESGGVESQVSLPTKAGEEEFDPALQAMITKESGGGYALTDETGESAGTVQFTESGQASELETGEFSGVQYDYSSGELSEIAVEDAASAAADPEEAALREELEEITPKFVSAFGTSGNGNGQFNVLNDVAIDPTDGSLWGSDDDNDRIEHFSASGEYLGKFASCYDPSAVQVEAAGNVYVACASGSSSVKKYSDTGTLLATIAGYGKANGQVNFPLGLALDAEENLWVADTENNRAEEFSPSGSFKKAISLGEFSRPKGIAVGSNGTVWVTETWANRVSGYDQEGKLLHRFGSSGSGQGQFAHPSDVAVDAHGYVWVADSKNDRVQIFNEAGEYITSFGEKGSGPGQLNDDWWIRLALDAKGNVWASDEGNHRIERWKSGNYFAAYKFAFGTSGNGNGQFNVLNDVAIDPTDGSLWGSDDDNDRIEHFSASGEYLGKFASCYDPGAVQVESAGNVYVACASGSSSIKKYSDTGTLLATIAGYGKANGQVNFPLGLALDAEENLWVADTENNRAEEFSPSGSFKKAISLGEFSRPKGIAVGSNGTVWVTETWANRVSGYDQEGKLLHRFGSSGSGQGQFAHPSDVAVDAHGYVWVADSKNDRVQIFNEAGEYITSFGEKGSGPGQLNDDWWIRLALDAKGNVWLSDEGNHRIERWRAPGITMTEPGVPMQDDPSLAVEVSEGLVEAVEGEQAGPVEYEHSGEQLTAVSCEEGETSYEYDEAGHMTKVELPNGSWAEIEYEATYGRVKAVKVSIEGGTAKTTHFEYTDSPSRSTRVVPEGPATVYDMAADGSFVRWQNAAKAPEIEELAGTLVDPEHRETANPIEPGAYLLEVKAYSEEGIAKIEVIANGNIQVDEKTCAEDFEKYEPECKNVADQWVTETGSWSPGILNLEVIVTDREGNEASERFWVNIPYTPPPDPEVEAPPTFSEVKTFREEFGLDLDLKGDEEAINERTWSLLRAWENPYTPAGEVARATSERWGVPLRQVDAAELEYREWFYHIDAERIDHWVQETKPSSFAGYYIDHAAGGVMHIGFTKDQIEQLDSLKASLSLVAGDRLQVYPAIPVASYLSVRAAWESVSSALESNSTLSELIVDVKFDEAGKTVRVGTPDVAQVEGILNQMVGTGGPISVEYEADEGSLLSGRYRNEGRMLAGDAIFSRHYTTGFVHDGSEEGGFKWSSQHLIEEGCDGKVEGLGIKADGSTADALAGSSTGRAS